MCKKCCALGFSDINPLHGNALNLFHIKQKSERSFRCSAVLDTSPFITCLKIRSNRGSVDKSFLLLDLHVWVMMQFCTLLH